MDDNGVKISNPNTHNNSNSNSNPNPYSNFNSNPNPNSNLNPNSNSNPNPNPYLDPNPYPNFLTLNTYPNPNPDSNSNPNPKSNSKSKSNPKPGLMVKQGGASRKPIVFATTHLQGATPVLLNSGNAAPDKSLRQKQMDKIPGHRELRTDDKHITAYEGIGLGIEGVCVIKES
ncbi:uncharacterized protein LOC131857835 [Cryptomeria japonica]|uniref:uncharacterized protein LOC131857835 n=1 Tax=Cryptomeria japonica TaxID=3369 RepID=UPI0027DA88BE|nr:uncharacterized protein LOC131857835 [Cryptomeria japonica]